jgi:hypothetical protein
MLDNFQMKDFKGGNAIDWFKGAGFAILSFPSKVSTFYCCFIFFIFFYFFLALLSPPFFISFNFNGHMVDAFGPEQVGCLLGLRRCFPSAPYLSSQQQPLLSSPCASTETLTDLSLQDFSQHSSCSRPCSLLLSATSNNELRLRRRRG